MEKENEKMRKDLKKYEGKTGSKKNLMNISPRHANSNFEWIYICIGNANGKNKDGDRDDDRVAHEIKEFEYTGLNPLNAKRKSVVDFMDNELNDFKSFVKTKVEPVKARILKIQQEITAFQNPILQELIQIRTQNESLLKELTRQKKVYREMLAEFYKMVAINDSHAETLSLKELG
jgi:hypothetical protein